LFAIGTKYKFITSGICFVPIIWGSNHLPDTLPRVPHGALPPIGGKPSFLRYGYGLPVTPEAVVRSSRDLQYTCIWIWNLLSSEEIFSPDTLAGQGSDPFMSAKQKTVRWTVFCFGGE